MATAIVMICTTLFEDFGIRHVGIKYKKRILKHELITREFC